MPEPRDPKPASEHTARVNAAVGATLGFDDEGDWERATRGLVATHPTGAFDGPLGTAWDVAEYDPRHLQRRLRHRRALTLDGDGLSRRDEGRSGPTALAMGLVHEVHPVTELKAKAIELAEELAAQPPSRPSPSPACCAPWSAPDPHPSTRPSPPSGRPSGGAAAPPTRSRA